MDADEHGGGAGTRIVDADLGRPRPVDRLLVELRGIWHIASVAVVRATRSHTLWLLLALVAGVLAVTGTLKDWVGGLSTWGAVGICVPAAAAYAVWRRKGPARILPFHNLVAGKDDKERFDLAAAALAEHLDDELRRIARLRSGVGLGLGGVPYVRAVKRGHSPAKRRRAGTFRADKAGQRARLGPAADAHATPADLGTLSVGPLRVPIGAASVLVAKWLTRTVGGKLFMSDDHLAVVAEHSDGHKWTVRRRMDHDDPTSDLRPLARELAARMTTDATRSEGDWRAVLALVDGLEHLERHGQTGSILALDGAAQAFAAAAAQSPRFAPAHYYLGVVHHHRLRLDWEERHADAARALYERAFCLDPKSAEASLALAHLEWELRGLREEDAGPAPSAARASTAITLLRKDGRPQYTARFQLAIALLETGRTGRALWHLALAHREIRSLRLAERLVGNDVTDLDLQLADIEALRAEAWEGVASNSRWRAKVALRLAARRIRASMRLDPASVQHRATLARILHQRGKTRKAALEIAGALERDRWSTDARAVLAALLAAGLRFKEAAIVACMALDVSTRIPAEWHDAAELVEATGDKDGAAALSAVALALAHQDAEQLERLVAEETYAVPLLHRPPVDWLLDRADRQAEQRSWKAAAAAYRRVLDLKLVPVSFDVAGVAIEVWPEAAAPAVQARAHAGLADAELRQGRLHPAAQAVAKAIELEPAYGWPHVVQAEILRVWGRWDEATALWELLQEQIPDLTPDAAEATGDVLFLRAQQGTDDQRRRQLWREAAARYRAAITAAGTSRRSQARLARCLVALGEREEAHALLVAMTPEAGEVWLYEETARAFADAGWAADAEQWLRTTLRAAEGLAGDDAVEQQARACNALARFLADHDLRLEEAQVLARRAVELATQASDTRSAALASESNGLLEDPAALSLLAESRDTLGWALHRIGQHDEAVDELRRAVDLEESTERRAHLALALEARAGRDDLAAARRVWARIRELDGHGEHGLMAAARLAADGARQPAATGTRLPPAADGA